MRFSVRMAAVVAVASLALAGCGDGSDSDNGDTTANDPAPAASAPASEAAGTSDLKIGLAYDVGGRGDQSFNDAAAAGLDKFTSETGAESEEASAVNGEAESAREERLIQLAESGFNPVVAVGFAYSAALAKVAPEFPDTDFAIIDDTGAQGENIANLTFAEDEGSFLVGVAAGLKSEAKNVGFVGGVEVPLIQKFERGFRAGVEAVAPDAEVQARYLTQPPDFSGFGDPAKGKVAAQGMYDAGADIVFQAAGGSGAGVFQAAKAAGALAIGVDSDQAKTADAAVADVIITSMLKKVDVAVYDFLKGVESGSPKFGETVYDLEAGGVDYSTTGGQVDDIADQLEEWKQKLISGEATIPAE